MKNLQKNLGYVFILLIAAFLTSCEKKYVTEEYYNEGTQIYTKEYTVTSEDWQEGTYDDGRKYLYAEFDNSDITNTVMEHGVVLAYYWFLYNEADNASSWNLLPYVYPYSYTTEENDTVYVGENFRFEYELGKIIFIVEDLDGVVPDSMTQETIFKVVTMKNM